LCYAWEMETPIEADWRTDPDLFASMPGGAALVEWFGFVPTFHDATLEGLEISEEATTLRLKAFRMTSEVDSAGYYVLDRHALVTISLSGVSGISLTGNATSIISELRIRRLSADAPGWHSCGGPEAGDFEIDFTSSYGLYGQLFARDLALGFTPMATPG
jgi:hypothetical protein